MSTHLLTAIESCPRRGLWSREWEPIKLSTTEILRRAVMHGLTTERQDFSESAGEYVMEFAAERGLDVNTSVVHQSLYDIALHHAALADIITSRLRSIGEFKAIESRGIGDHTWVPNCLETGVESLARVILCSRWDEERLAAELHSWYTLGEMVIYERPITLHVIVLGAHKYGKRHSAWTKGVLHPRNKALRFKRDPRGTTGAKNQPFGENWIPIWREDYAQISRQQWLVAMQRDRMFEELHLVYPVKLPERPKLDQLRKMMEKKMGAKYKGIPDPNYSQCDNPISPCFFRRCCLGKEESEPSTKEFIKL